MWSKWKTCRNVKTWWIYDRKFIRLFVSSKYYKLIVIDLSRQANTSIPQQINFTEKLEDDGEKIFIVSENQQKSIPNFPLDSLIVIERYDNGALANIKLRKRF